MNASNTPRALAGLSILAATLLAACATPMANPNLEAARASYDRAASDPVVAQAAPKELVRAQQELARADDAVKANKDATVVDHYAYLASQRTQVAIETARIARADQAAADAKTQRERIVLESRTREAETARMQAEAARMQADAARTQAAVSQQRAGELEAQLAALQAKQTDRGMVLTLGDVLFDTGRATLKPGAMKTIDDLASFMQQHPERKVLIEGYTDSVGSETTNQELSERRAEAVRDALMRRAVPFDHVQVHGLGERYPVASNDTGAGRQLNRRVEVVFSNNNGMFDSPRG
jgi:outer membrane protein OmpA-like peptidoglycan-associated protein